ncbi:MAG: hypothetical protein L0G22_08250 [Propionibacteriaceae bacterium]|nr:hypothetical protein [Propionibacteriaceae bacterium]
MRRVAAGVGALCVWALLASGCVRTPEPSPTPTPKPSFQCTPEAGGDAYPCDQHDYERMVQRDAEYVEAERIAKRVRELSDELLVSKQPINDELRSLATGETQAGLESALADASATGVDFSGAREIAWVKRAPYISDRGSVIALEVCTTPGTMTYTVDGVQYSPTSTLEQVFFSRSGEVLQISSIITSEVDQC